MDIAAAVQTFSDQAERSADLDRRDREYGGLVPGDRQAEDIAAAVAAWVPPYRASATKRDVREALKNLPDPREISTGRLMFDVSRAVRRWCGKWSPADRDIIANGAALLLLRWPTQGTSPVLDLGGERAERLALAEFKRAERSAAAAGDPLARARAVIAWMDRAERLLAVGTLPLRRDWIAEHGGASPLALRALHAAVKQAADEITPNADVEISTDPLDIAAAMERETADAGEISRLPDVQAPELIARYLDISLDAARAITARAFPHASPTDLAAAWEISRQAVANALQRGAAALLKAYPDPAALLEALARIAPAYRTDCETGATLALIDWRDGWISEDIARSAVKEWRDASQSMGDVERAILASARAAIKRAGGQYGSERAERIAASVGRILPAEQSAARRSTRLPRVGRLDTCAVSAQRAERPHLAPQAAADVAAARERLRHLLDAGSANADEIKALRAGIAAALA